MLPKANHRQMIQFVQDEFVDVQSQYEDLLYDYTILKEKVEDKEGQLVLCAALEREFLKPYIDLFKEMGISISSIDILTNSVIKLTESIDKLKNQSYILTAINGQDVNHYLFINGQYEITLRNPTFLTRKHLGKLLRLYRSQNPLSLQNNQ